MESQFTLERLKQKQEWALSIAKQKLNQYCKIIEEYETLKNNLEMLVKKINHPIMAPICHNMRRDEAPLAFMPGYLDHTNQIMVLLGDNWFVERSVHQAVEIVNRRIQFAMDKKNEVNKEIEQINSWFKFTTEMAEEKKGLVEIVEDYDEDEERKWREEHRRKVKEQKERERRERQQNEQQK